MANTRNHNANNNNENGENNNTRNPPPPTPRASSDNASSNAPNYAADNGQYATKSAGTTATTKRQTWRFSEDQVAKLLALHGVDGRR
jgi:hypothetical protein